MAGPEKRYNVADVVREARLTKPAIVLTGFPSDPEAEFRIDPPELWGDAINDAAAKGQATEVSKLLLGDQYDAFKRAGGSNSTINLVLAEHTQQEDLGKSSASTDS